MSFSDNKRSLIKLSPLLIPWFFITAGLLLTLLQSFGYLVPLRSAGTGGAYLQVLGNIHIWQSLGFSLYVAFTTAALSTLSGFSIALLFWQLPTRWQRITAVYKILLILPHISVAYIAILLFSRTGLVSAVLFQLGFINDFKAFPSLIFDNRGFGIILGYLMKEIPFVVLMIGASLQKIPYQMIQTARMLGGKKLYITRRIIIPSCLNSLLSSFVILFLYSFGGFEMPFILGGSKPVMISITVYDMLFRKGFAYRPEAMVILLTILSINLIVLFLFFKLSRIFHAGKLLL